MKQIVAISFFFASLSTLHASYHPEGLEVYEKECISCHSDAHTMAQTHKQIEWEKILFSSSTPMYDLHKNKKDIKDRFVTKCGESNKEDLFAFLVNNAKDSGKVPNRD